MYLDVLNTNQAQFHISWPSIIQKSFVKFVNSSNSKINVDYVGNLNFFGLVLTLSKYHFKRESHGDFFNNTVIVKTTLFQRYDSTLSVISNYRGLVFFVHA